MPIRVDYQDVEDGWYRALFQHDTLIVSFPHGEETYHPPYPHSDSTQEMLDAFPGMASCISYGHVIMWCNDTPKSIHQIALESYCVLRYAREGRTDIIPQPDWGFCQQMVEKYGDTHVRMD